MIPLQHFSVSLSFGACYMTGQWDEFRIKNAFFGFYFVLFLHKISVFIIFVSFFDKESNFRGRISTNQKQELVVQNCQWNFMYKQCHVKTSPCFYRQFCHLFFKCCKNRKLAQNLTLKDYVSFIS